jgi:hypothetical protein
MRDVGLVCEITESFESGQKKYKPETITPTTTQRTRHLRCWMILP